MSLSKQIIFENDIKQLKKAVFQYKEDINKIDEYGYTPLIQTAIVNSVEKAKILLEAQANVDMTDLSGRTALFWAAENDNYELCKELLYYGADSNLYMYSGQSPLVIPMLKKQKNIKKLLINGGARENFAQDFIDVKLLGHSFELEGRVDIVDHTSKFIEIELEGFFPRFTLEILAHSLLDFRGNFAGKHLKKYFSKLDIAIKALYTATELIKYQNYLIDIEKYSLKINDLLDCDPLILPVSFDGHAITFIKAWDWLIRCDRGEFGRKNGTVILYEIQDKHKWTKDFCKQLMYKRQSREFINNGLINFLNLEKVIDIPVPPQSVGNCTWANIEAVVPAIMFLLLLEENGPKALDMCEKISLDFYNEWREWSKTRSLDFCIQNFYTSNQTRQAAKTTWLAAMMFQSFKYGSQFEQEKANKVLDILTMPKYNYVLKSYLKVFSDKGISRVNDESNVYMQNLFNFLDDFGVNIEELKNGEI